ncbi:halocyanin domain-containing protein [Halobaculum rubrum]|uniref:halocyanin domain-containing protein n=1 Tax=Halobaculum rubrum TaxID=2872158 RepID=UPI001CA4435E|nr:halocyanin domain-containing protein [Halobaculum rubrum]QZX99285.1 halocyanin domain-containing protein [Halobaculum rubrum]
MRDPRTSSVSRRDVLRTALAGGVAAAGGGAAAAPAAAQSSGGLEEWFSDVSNYDGVVDETGADSVTVEVGTQANGGGYGFGPAAVRVDPGATVTWEWTGNGGSHNVAAEGDASFESELVGDAGHTFEHTFEAAGVYRYACTPHKALGMKGAVVVGDAAVGGSGDGGGSDGTSSSGTETSSTTEPAGGTNESAGGGADGGSGGDGGGAGDAPALLLLGGGIGAVLSPLVFGLFMLLFGDDDDGQGGADPGYRTDGGSRSAGAADDGAR